MSGAQLVTVRSAPVGSSVEFELLEHGEAVLPLMGTVRRVERPARRMPRDGVLTLSVEFIGVNDKARARLENWVGGQIHDRDEASGASLAEEAVGSAVRPDPRTPVTIPSQASSGDPSPLEATDTSQPALQVSGAANARHEGRLWEGSGTDAWDESQRGSQPLFQDQAERSRPSARDFGGLSPPESADTNGPKQAASIVEDATAAVYTEDESLNEDQADDGDVGQELRRLRDQLARAEALVLETLSKLARADERIEELEAASAASDAEPPDSSTVHGILMVDVVDVVDEVVNVEDREQVGSAEVPESVPARAARVTFPVVDENAPTGSEEAAGEKQRPISGAVRQLTETETRDDDLTTRTFSRHALDSVTRRSRERERTTSKPPAGFAASLLSPHSQPSALTPESHSADSWPELDVSGASENESAEVLLEGTPTNARDLAAASGQPNDARDSGPSLSTLGSESARVPGAADQTDDWDQTEVQPVTSHSESAHSSDSSANASSAFAVEPAAWVRPEGTRVSDQRSESQSAEGFDEIVEDVSGRVFASPAPPSPGAEKQAARGRENGRKRELDGGLGYRELATRAAMVQALAHGVIELTERFRRLEPVSRADIETADLLESTRHLDELEKRAAGRLEREQLHGVLFVFLQRGLFVVRPRTD